MQCFFVSDLHGRLDRYDKLFARIAAERPEVVFLGGDLLPHPPDRQWALDLGRKDFVNDVLAAGFRKLVDALGTDYPRVLLILGNDDPRFEEAAVIQVAAEGVWTYMHKRRVLVGATPVYGYACVPPTPFQMKDWERYDVSRYVDPGCVSPEDGLRSVPVRAHEIRAGTIMADLEQLVNRTDVHEAVFLFHCPPYRTKLDRAALDGKVVDHVPVDVHVGSIAIERLIRRHQPRISLHGHVHESARLTGAWQDRLGQTYAFSAAHDGPELALVRFDSDRPEQATRELC